MDKHNRERPYNVLFLCTGNSARSIMGEAILSRFGAGKFKSFSAGSQPKGEVHPRVAHLLKTLNYKPELYAPRAGRNSPVLRLNSISCSLFATTPPMRSARCGPASR